MCKHLRVTTSAHHRPVGRPRVRGRSTSGLSPRQEVLQAAAELFTVHGYSATTTRAVSDLAGMRQASMYHYFGGKEDILAELLEGTVRPSLEIARDLVSRTEVRAEERLWALCRADVELLCGGRHNLGALYLLPEVRAERFADFRRTRAELKQVYRDLLAATVQGMGLRGRELAVRADLLFGLVESITLIRREDQVRHDVVELAEAAADAALRVSGISDARLPRIRRAAALLLKGRFPAAPARD
jgi:AcrR family transcriptional regulator